MGASFLFAALVFLGSSLAAGHPTFAADSFQLRRQMTQGPTSAIYWTPPSDKAAPVVRPGQPLLLNPSAGVGFTMRTYKVKPTEEWQDSFNGGSQKYSTCRMGSDYRMQNAVTPASK